MAGLLNSYRFGGGLGTSWRVRVLASVDGYVWIRELEMALSISGATVCTGGTPIESGHLGSSVPSYAFDGGANAWVSGGPEAGPRNTQWIGYRFPVAIRPAEISITGHSVPGDAPYACVLERSNDEILWTPVAVFSRSTAWTAYERMSWPVPPVDVADDISQARGWRMHVTALCGGSRIICNELVFASSVGGASLCNPYGGASSVVIANAGAALVANAFDTNTATAWQSPSSSFAGDDYIENWADTPYIPAEMRYRGSTANTQSPADFTIQWSSNGVDYHVYRTFSGYTTGWGSSSVIRSFPL